MLDTDQINTIKIDEALNYIDAKIEMIKIFAQSKTDPATAAAREIKTLKEIQKLLDPK